MPRPVATSALFSVAIHATLLAVLVGIRFTASDRPEVGVIEVEYFIVADRIDAGTAPRDGVTAIETPGPEDSLPPPSPDPTDDRPASDAAAANPAPAAPSNAAEPMPAPPPPKPPPVQTADAPPAAPTAALESAVAAVRPDAPPVAAAVDVSLPALPQTPAEAPAETHAETPAATEALSESTAASAETPSAAVATAAADTPPPHSPLTAKVQDLTLDGDGFSVPSEPVVFEHDGAEFTATFTEQPAAADTDLDRLIVAVSTESHGERRSTEMHFKRLSFSHFAQFVDRWDPAVQIHDDEIDGRFHANSEIYIDTSRGIQPKFHGRVTTSRGVSTSSGTRSFRRRDVFLGGIETRIRRIPLPADLAVFPVADESSERVHRFGADARIVFLSGGSYVWQPLDESAPTETRRLSVETTYLVAADGADLHVSGVVDGRVLVYSPDRIVIEGDLEYAADPEEVSASDDFLGLVADRTVEIAEPDVTGPGDLDVHASIYAKRRFVIRSYRSRELGTLSILGSVTAGSLTASEPRYRTKVRFDRRLENARPPSFPTTDRWELAKWDGQWREN